MTAKIDMRELARRGAHETIKELVQHFGPSIIATPATQRSATPAQPVRRRKPMTPAQKREVSRRMKKYWAGRRKSSN